MNRFRVTNSPRLRPAIRIGIAVWLPLLVLTLGAWSSALAQTAEELTIGQKESPTQRLLAELTAQTLEARGIPIVQAEPMGSAIIRKAQETERVDLYWESPATALFLAQRFQEPVRPEGALTKIRQLDVERDLVWFGPSAIEQRLVVAMRAVDSRDMGIRSLSDLAAASEAGAELAIASSVEFSRRADGILTLQKVYGLKIRSAQVIALPLIETVEALVSEAVDVAVVSDLDPRVARFGLAVLADDLDAFPMGTLVPVVRREALERFSALSPALDALVAALNTATAGRMNRKVLIDQAPLGDVAEEFLRDSGLL